MVAESSQHSNIKKKNTYKLITYEQSRKHSEGVNLRQDQTFFEVYVVLQAKNIKIVTMVKNPLKRFLDPNCDLDDHQIESIVLVVKKTHALQTLTTQPSRETQIFRGDIRKVSGPGWTLLSYYRIRTTFCSLYLNNVKA